MAFSATAIAAFYAFPSSVIRDSAGTYGFVAPESSGAYCFKYWYSSDFTSWSSEMIWGSTAYVYACDLVMDSNFALHACAAGYINSGHKIKLFKKVVGGSWAEDGEISISAIGTPTAIRYLIGPSGAEHIIICGGDNKVRHFYRKPGETSFTTGAVITDGDEEGLSWFSLLDAVLDQDENISVFYWGYDGSDTAVVEATTREDLSYAWTYVTVRAASNAGLGTSRTQCALVAENGDRYLLTKSLNTTLKLYRRKKNDAAWTSETVYYDSGAYIYANAVLVMASDGMFNAIFSMLSGGVAQAHSSNNSSGSWSVPSRVYLDGNHQYVISTLSSCHPNSYGKYGQNFSTYSGVGFLVNFGTATYSMYDSPSTLGKISKGRVHATQGGTGYGTYAY